MDPRFLLTEINAFLPAQEHQLSKQSMRLFHGRGHAYPNYEHVCIDWFSGVLLITLYQAEDSQSLSDLAQLLAQRFNNAKAILLQHRYQHGAPVEKLWGEAAFESIAYEGDLGYHISFNQSQNHGLFLDMKNGRDWVKANSKDANVLNLFAYTCAFSVAAMSGGAKQVVNVDLSKASLSRGRENHRLNQQDTRRVKYEGVNIFKSYSRLKKHGPYDLLICDPPSFQKGSVDIKRDYKKIIKRLPELMNNQGKVMLCLNSPDLDEAFLKQEVARECPACQFEHSIEPPAVFKEAIAGKGLKTLIYRYTT